MAKARKERTQAQIEADQLRMAKVRAARQNKNPQKEDTYQITNPEQVMNILETTDEPIVSEKSDNPFYVEDTPVQEPSKTIDQQDVGELIKQIQELKDMQFMLMADKIKSGGNTDAATVSNGKLTGTVEKYILDPNNYPDPRDRLRAEKKLQRFAFDLNYELQWIIGESRYETIDHVRMVEPRFNLILTRIMLDEFSGADTGGRYDVAQIIMHEDPTAAMIIAQQQELDIPREDERLFLNELRYIRLRDWLIDCFYPPAPTTTKQKRDMVIDGRLVEYYEKNVEEGTGKSGIGKSDWDNLPRVKF